MLQDIRFGFRLLRKTPILSGAIVLTLALGIGLDAGVFNLIDGLLFRPRVDHDPEAFVQVGVEYSGPNAPARAGLPYVNVNDFQRIPIADALARGGGGLVAGGRHRRDGRGRQRAPRRVAGHVQFLSRLRARTAAPREGLSRR
jgi:hypothetical protein